MILLGRKKQKKFIAIDVFLENIFISVVVVRKQVRLSLLSDPPHSFSHFFFCYSFSFVCLTFLSLTFFFIDHHSSLQHLLFLLFFSCQNALHLFFFFFFLCASVMTSCVRGMNHHRRTIRSLIELIQSIRLSEHTIVR